MGYGQSDELTDKQLLAEAQKMYNVYHIHVNEGSYKDDPNVLGYWKGMLNERLILNDMISCNRSNYCNYYRSTVRC